MFRNCLLRDFSVVGVVVVVLINVVSNRKPHVNVGTIGHVDHGKTTLTAAITRVCFFVFLFVYLLSMRICFVFSDHG